MDVTAAFLQQWVIWNSTGYVLQRGVACKTVQRVEIFCSFYFRHYFLFISFKQVCVTETLILKLEKTQKNSFSFVSFLKQSIPQFWIKIPISYKKNNKKICRWERVRQEYFYHLCAVAAIIWAWNLVSKSIFIFVFIYIFLKIHADGESCTFTQRRLFCVLVSSPQLHSAPQWETVQLAHVGKITSP